MADGDTSGLPEGQRVEVVREALEADLRAEVAEFLVARGGLDPEDAEERTPEVVCVLRNDAGAIVAASLVRAAGLRMVGGLSFWVYEATASDGIDADGGEELIAATRDTLAAEFAERGEGPIGLCMVVTAEIAARRPEAIWPRSRMMLVGYDGSDQVRIRYFDWSTPIL